MKALSNSRASLTASQGDSQSAKGQAGFDFDILGTKWRVKVAELFCEQTGNMQFGFMNAENRTLTINQDTDPSWRLYLLLHEVLHALVFLGHLQFLRHENFPAVDDESKIDAIASLLAEVMNRNHLSNTAALSEQPAKAMATVMV